MNPLALAETLLAQGNEARARKLVLKYRLLPAQTPQEYIAWGKLCEDLAMPKQAIECYQKALASSPGEPLAIKSLGILQFELGDYDAAKRLLRRYLALDPEDEEVRKTLGKIYLGLGEKGSYEALFPKKSKMRVKIKGPRVFPREFGQKELEVFEPFLKGYPAYLELSLNQFGKPVQVFRDQALDYELLAEHLYGHKFLLFYPIDQNMKTNIATFRVYCPLKFLHRDLLRRKKAEIPYLVLKILRKLRAMGLPCVLEQLTPWNYLFWFVLKEPVHFLVVKRFLGTLEEKLPYPEEKIRYHTWLYTVPHDLAWKEVAIPLPLGINPLTKARSAILNEEGDPLPNPLLAFKKLRYLSPTEVKEFYRRGELKWQGPSRSLELEKILKQCALLKHLVEKASSGRNLTRNEKLALFLTIGLLDPEGALLHQVLHPTPDYRYQRVERQRKGLPPNPISCYKMREWFPDLASIYGCHCVFEKDIRYPSPVLHVAPNLVPPEEPLTLEHLKPKELAKRYVFYLREKEKLEEKLSTIEDELKTYLGQKPGKKLDTGKYYLELKEGKLTLTEKERR